MAIVVVVIAIVIIIVASVIRIVLVESCIKDFVLMSKSFGHVSRNFTCLTRHVAHKIQDGLKINLLIRIGIWIVIVVGVVVVGACVLSWLIRGCAFGAPTKEIHDFGNVTTFFVSSHFC